MRSDFSVKGIACLQVAIYNALNARTRQLPSPIAKTAAVCASTLDIFLDTLKHPCVALEQTGMCVVNVAGASCSPECSLSDAANSLKLTAIASCATVVASVIAIPKWFIQTSRALSRPETIRSCNELADKQAKFKWILYRESVLA